MDYKILTIEATTLSDAWFQAVYNCLEHGRDFNIDRGSYEGSRRLEFDYITINIKKPGERPLLPEIPSQYNIPNPVPGGMIYVDDYLANYLMGSELQPGESYTYGQRLIEYPISVNWVLHFDKEFNRKILIQDLELWGNKKIIIRDKESVNQVFLNQIELVIWTYKNKGYRNNQMVMQIAHPTDCLLKDPPCLRQIDTRIQDDKLHFIVYFRSWDLWGGFPANLAAIQQMKEIMADRIGVEDGSMVVSSKGLHLYNYVWQLAEIIRGKTMQEFREGI